MAHKRFCFKFFKNFIFVPVDLEFNSALGNQTYIKNVGVVLRKAMKLETWKSGLKKNKKKTFVTERLQMESGGTKIFVHSRL